MQQDGEDKGDIDDAEEVDGLEVAGGGSVVPEGDTVALSCWGFIVYEVDRPWS